MVETTGGSSRITGRSDLEGAGPLQSKTRRGDRLQQSPRRTDLLFYSDAHESTLMVIEAGEENAVPWMAPVDADESLVLSLGPRPTTSLHHSGGMNASFVLGEFDFNAVGRREIRAREMASVPGLAAQAYSVLSRVP